MSLDLLSLPWDTIVVSLLHLPVSSILNLQQTCRFFNGRISEDKQLWVNVMERDVLSKGINLHPLRAPLELASAAHVRTWIRSAICMQQAHSNNSQPIVTRLKLDLRVTWLKIVRTCWCLVASSTETESRLTLWNVRNGCSIVKEYYLPGPVVDGVVEDDGTDVTAALTIGTTEMYIQVVSVYKDAICSLTALRGVSYVRSLNGPWIVCAVRDGDDTFPTAVNWRDDRRRRLIHGWYIIHSDNPWSFTYNSVRNATQWRNWLVLITAKTVEIFQMEDLDRHVGEIVAIASLPIRFSRWTLSGEVADVDEASFHLPGDETILSFSCRLANCSYLPCSVGFDGNIISLYEGYVNEAKEPAEDCSEECLENRFEDCFEDCLESFLDSPADSKNGYPSFPIDGNKFVIGSSSNYEVHLRTKGGHDLLPDLIFVNIDRSKLESALVGATSPRAVVDGFPLLQFTTGMDFDDTVGLVAIGTCKGYLCFARFFAEDVTATGAFLDELLSKTEDTAEELSAVSLSMDIPSYYSKLIVSKDLEDFSLPRAYIEEVIKTWPPLPDGSLASGPWSNDWLRYEGVRNLVVPADRWPINDCGGNYDLWPVVFYIRTSLSMLGDIIPLAYRQDPETIIFRVGPRCYMITFGLDDGQLDYIAGALPNLNLNMPLSGDYLESLRYSDFWNNMSMPSGNEGALELHLAAGRVDSFLDDIRRHSARLESEMSRIGSDPNSWTAEEIEMIGNKMSPWH